MKSLCLFSAVALAFLCSIGRPFGAPSIEAGTQVPVSFDRFKANGNELRLLGLPPRPDRRRAQSAFAAWTRLTSPLVTTIKPKLVVTGRTHYNVSRSNVPGKFNTNYSVNWSGYGISAPVTKFGSESQYAVFSEFNVPIAIDPFGTCPPAAYASIWTGLDGVGTSDVVQAGVEADVFCNAGSRSTSYYAWIEWFPGLEMKVANFPISPGDVIEEEVWETSLTTAEALILDETKNTLTEVGVSAPTGVTFSGASAEWVVETPSLGGAQTSLTNYTKVFTDVNVSLLNNSSHVELYPGWLAQGFTLTQYMMVDSSGHGISQAALNGPCSFSFTVEGSAK